VQNNTCQAHDNNRKELYLEVHASISIKPFLKTPLYNPSTYFRQVTYLHMLLSFNI
jgi:hypothetical protein